MTISNFKDSPVVSLGSCFSAEMGMRMAEEGYDVCCNPFGVLYNPASIASSLLRLAGGRHFTIEDVVPRDTNPVRAGRPQKAVSPEHRPIAPQGLADSFPSGIMAPLPAVHPRNFWSMPIPYWTNRQKFSGKHVPLLSPSVRHGYSVTSQGISLSPTVTNIRHGSSGGNVFQCRT